MQRFAVALLAAFVLASSSASAGQIRVGLVLKALGSEFWRNVKAGAEEAAREDPAVKLTVMAPDRELNVEQQVRIVEDLLAQGIDVLALAPCGKELLPVMDSADRMGVPVVLVDTDAPWPKKAAYVGTDNVIGGRLAGAYIAKRLGGKGEVGIITGVMGNQTMMDRVKGVEETLARYPDITIVSVQPANSERATAMTVMKNMLDTHPGLDAVFSATDPMAMAALEAITAKRSKCIVIGFNADKKTVESIRDGGMAATVAQNSFNIGRYGVETAVRAFRKEKLPPYIDTGTELVTKENAGKFLK